MSDVHLNTIAENYVKLVLSVGLHDRNYVDAYYGPEEWKHEIEQQQPRLDTINDKAQGLLDALSTITLLTSDDKLRCQYLTKQLTALKARVAQLRGYTYSFDEEATLFYDVVPPKHDEAYFRRILDELDTLIPGTSSIAERAEKFRKQFIIPSDFLQNVFHTAITESKKRTVKYLPLPDSESFRLEFVRQKPWNGYNWYKGYYSSLIQINTDLPILLERVIDLAAHEGYPGHHVYNCLIEQECLKNRSWIEFSIYALFSPQSLVAEGTANYGIEMVFPGNERTEYEKEVLMPLCKLSTEMAAQYARLQQISVSLNYAHNEAARHYLDGEWSFDQAKEWLITYALLSPERAEQRIRFIETYRSYVINYNVGLDIVRSYCEKYSQKNNSKRWEVFSTLLKKPVVPSELIK